MKCILCIGSNICDMSWTSACLWWRVPAVSVGQIRQRDRCETISRQKADSAFHAFFRAEAPEPTANPFAHLRTSVAVSLHTSLSVSRPSFASSLILSLSPPMPVDHTQHTTRDAATFNQVWGRWTHWCSTSLWRASPEL